MATALLLFHRQLRLRDNPALVAAARSGQKVLPVFVWDADRESDRGAASRWWLHHSLKSLRDDMKARWGLSLPIVVGPLEKVIPELVRQHSAEALFFNRSYEARGLAVEKKLLAALPSSCRVESFNATSLWEPAAVLNKTGQPYKVYTAFWKACLAAPPPPDDEAVPRNIAWASTDKISSVSLDSLGLLPKISWDKHFSSEWEVGEAGAEKALKRFLEKPIDHYSEGRNLPAERGTSRLSPHLAFGEISARRVWHEVVKRKAHPRLNESCETYLKEIVWREFAHHLLFHFPTMDRLELREDFRCFPWRKDGPAWRAWTRGVTGFPIVDAGLRELWATGWMHNRVRMIAASFLVKNLLLDWRRGAEWFLDTLVDADLANNSMGWQWVAGCGVDAAPFFRIFNPVLQGEKFDPEGSYVKKWCPELARVPARWVHAPWKADAALRREWGVAFRSYPDPMVDLSETRDRALLTFKQL